MRSSAWSLQIVHALLFVHRVHLRRTLPVRLEDLLFASLCRCAGTMLYFSATATINRYLVPNVLAVIVLIPLACVFAQR